MPPPTQTPNLFINTSLEEEIDYSNTQHTGPPARRDDARDLALHRAMAAQTRQQPMTVEEAARIRRAGRSNQKLDQLTKHRERESVLLSLSRFYMEQWSASDPEKHASFMRHLRNAALAADQPVRIFDIASWYGKTCFGVNIALRRLQKHYHAEACLQYDLRRLEEKEGSWSSRTDLHHEVLVAVEQNARRSYPDETAFWRFGLYPKEDQVIDFDDRFMEKGEEEKRLAFIYANFKVRCTLLRADIQADLTCQARPRYSQDGSEKKLVDTLDFSVIKWCREAITRLEAMAVSVQIGCRLERLLRRVIIEIQHYITGIDTIGLCHMLDIVKKEVLPLVQAGTEGIYLGCEDGPGTAQCYAQADFLAVRLRHFRQAFEDYEETYGRNVLGTEWKGSRPPPPPSSPPPPQA